MGLFAVINEWIMKQPPHYITVQLWQLIALAVIVGFISFELWAIRRYG